MGEQLAEGAAGGEFRPDGLDWGVRGEVGVVEGEEEGEGGGAFGGGPDGDEGIVVPCIDFLAGARSFVEGDDFAAVEPDGEGGADFAAGGEVVFEGAGEVGEVSC